MTIKTRIQKFCLLIILMLVAASIPTSNVSAAWSGEFTLSSATYSANEFGGSVRITIRLTGKRVGSKPWNAAVHYATSNGTASAGSDYTAVSGTQTMKKAGTWSFSVPITNDMAIEGNETFNVTLTNPTNGATLGTLSSAVVAILDDDAAGISVTPTSGLEVSEMGDTDTFTMVLLKQPTSTVTVGLSSSDTSEGTVYPTSISFTNRNWYLARTVTVTGMDDLMVDGDIPFTIVTAPAVSTDPLYSGINASDVSVTNLDDDFAGITVNPTSGLVVSEPGGTDTFTVVLDTQPLMDVTIALSSSDTLEGTVSPALLTFTSDNWYTPREVTVTGVNDENSDGNVYFMIVTASAVSEDPAYSGFDADDVEVVNLDDDVPAVYVTPISGLEVTEAGGTDTFDIVLNTLPVDDVSITLTSSDLSEGTVSPAALVFTAENGDTPQTVTITGVNDFIADGDILFSIVTAAALSTDPDYNGMNASDVSITSLDDDIAGITVTPTNGLIVNEMGTTDTFTVVLDTQPSAEVTIALTSLDTTEGMVSPASLTFTTDNWYAPREVTVTGVDDGDIDWNIYFTIETAAAVSTDPAYGGFDADDVEVVNLDDDGPAIYVTPTSGLIVSEAGGTDAFDVVLNTQPADDVTIDFNSSDTTEGTVSPLSLLFTTSDWDTPRTVTVIGVNDLIDDGDVEFVITGLASSSDNDYDAYETDDVTATNMDDDTAGISITPTGGLSVSEAGGTATFSAVLDTEPTDEVTIDLSSSDLTEGTVFPLNLTFTIDNWDTPQTVTVSGVDDPGLDGDILFSILTDNAVSTDYAYNGLDASDVSITCQDDETSNTPPTAVSDDYSTLWRKALTVSADLGVLDNDTDAELDHLTAELFSGPTPDEGVLTLNPDGSFTFTPADHFAGDATFTYRAYDGSGYSSTVTVTIHIVVHRIFLPLTIRP